MYGTLWMEDDGHSYQHNLSQHLWVVVLRDGYELGDIACVFGMPHRPTTHVKRAVHTALPVGPVNTRDTRSMYLTPYKLYGGTI